MPPESHVISSLVVKHIENTEQLDYHQIIINQIKDDMPVININIKLRGLHEGMMNFH